MRVTIEPLGSIVWESIILPWWTWAQDYFGKLLSLNTVRRNNKCNLKVYYVRGRHLLILHRNTAEFSGPEVIWDGPKDSRNVFSGQNFSQELHVYFSRTMSGLILHEWQQRGFVGIVRVLDWPACSPDLSPIVIVWWIMKRRIRQQQPRTVDQLKSCVTKRKGDVTQW